MTLRSIEIFSAVAEHANMTSAAKALFVSQSSVSQCITDMEHRYNVKLFERFPGGLRITPTGQVLVQKSKMLLAARKELDDFLNHESKASCIRIGATATVGACIICPIVSKLQEVMNECEVHVVVNNAHDITEKLLNNDLDIALIVGKISNPDIEVEIVTEDKLALICSVDHPFSKFEQISVHDLKNEPLILREPGSSTRENTIKALANYGVTPKVCWDSSGFDTIIDAVEFNLGVSLVSLLMAKKESSRRKIHVCTFSDAEFPGNFSLVYHRSKIFSKQMSIFADICRETTI